MGPYNVRGLVAVLSLFLVSCGTSTAPSEKSTAQVATRSLEAPAKPQLAVVGQPAPDFSLDDLDGVPFQLSGQLGKTVVLEWFNPDCPFVALAHERVESLKGLGPALRERQIVMVAINSGGPGRQGHGAEANNRGRTRFGIDYPILLDPTGSIGQLYGAQRTPHMYVIDPSGVLVYRGAIDNTEGGDLEDADPLVNYVTSALGELDAGTEVSAPETTAWGCTVKYAKK